MSEKIDRFGMVASSLCAVHCAMSAMIPALFTAFGLGLLLSHETEWLFTILAIIFALSAALVSWKKVRSMTVLLLFTAGIIGLLGSRVLEMGSDHHGGHGHHHAEQTEVPHHATKADHEQPHDSIAGEVEATKEADHQHEKHNETEDHHLESPEHGLAALWGVIISSISGLSLVYGHILNIRLTRRKEEE